MTQTQRLTEVEGALEWLVASGAQIQSTDATLDGGFISWYDEETGQAAYVYSEITGYMLTLLCSAAKRYRDPALLASAVRAGEWFLRTADPATGGFRCLYPLSPTRFAFKHDLVYTFDCGVILSGLVCLYRATNDQRFLTASNKLADWLTGTMQLPNGGFRPLYNLADGSYPTNDDEWSLCPGSYHTKIAIGLLNLYDVTRDPQLLQAVRASCDHALSFQQPDGRFVSFPQQGGTNTHPHSYSAEGLWVVGRYLGRADYLDASARAAAWTLSHQSDEGLVPRHFQQGQPVYHERVDVLCQALRLGVIHRAEGRLGAEFDAGIAQLRPLIARNQSDSADPRAAGAFYFGRQSDGTQVRHANVWVSSFAIQALMLYDGLVQGEYDFQPFEMV